MALTLSDRCSGHKKTWVWQRKSTWSILWSASDRLSMEASRKNHDLWVVSYLLSLQQKTTISSSEVQSLSPSMSLTPSVNAFKNVTMRINPFEWMTLPWHIWRLLIRCATVLNKISKMNQIVKCSVNSSKTIYRERDPALMAKLYTFYFYIWLDSVVTNYQLLFCFTLLSWRLIKTSR